MSAPVKHTCPDIDGLQTDIMRNAKDVCEELEKLRNSNYDLRAWGEKLELELEDAEDTISDLRDEIKDLEHEVADLKSELRSIERNNV